MAISVGEYRKKGKRRESDVQRAICEYLTLKRIPFSITDATAVLNMKGQRVASKARRGWPDITAVLQFGKALFIECKSTTGRVRPEQQAVHDELREQGAVVIVARSIEDVQDGIRDYVKPAKDGISVPNGKQWIHRDGRPGSR